MGKWKTGVVTSAAGAVALTLGTTMLAPRFSATAATIGLAMLICVACLATSRIIQSATSGIADLKRRADALQASVQTLHDSLTPLTEIDALSARSASLEATASQTLSQLKRTRGLVASLADDVTELHHDVNEAKAHSRTTRAGIKALRSEMKATRRPQAVQGADVTALVTQLEQQVAGLAAQQAETLTAIDILQVRLTSAMHHLDAMPAGARPEPSRDRDD